MRLLLDLQPYVGNLKSGLKSSKAESGHALQVLSYPFRHCRCTGLVRRSVQGIWH